ncbi:deoxyribonuclease IV [Ruminococcus sp.]|uniref:deoxyribonuclease IV n=1 Tax=Ruminococcus sp. TaxID=41978 RepID=UPI0026263AF1|nr:deoxyribonuclease IV [Ruminococcus sp.]MDD6989175.1 deoxyribonuclease IV [Ruminococcus sp.]MDY6202430.1 deoxyribonuclease IV [Ruminococcus sp.]
MLNIGCHLSISNGFEAIGKQALEIGANTFQFFTRNPRGGSARKIEQTDVYALKLIMRENGFSQILAHAPYTMNLCSAKPETREFALNTLKDDLQRMEYLPDNLYNFHPGSHTGQGVENGTEHIISALNEAMFPQMHTTVLLETMAGKGTEIGGKFEELSAIIDGVENKDKIGVCLDTCHVFDAGYDIVNDLDGVIEKFDRIIGLDRLKAVHLNDSMNYLGCHKDRHQKIGEGAIGIDAFRRIINHPALKNLPFLLETPNEIEGYACEISLLKSMVE